MGRLTRGMTRLDKNMGEGESSPDVRIVAGLGVVLFFSGLFSLIFGVIWMFLLLGLWAAPIIFVIALLSLGVYVCARAWWLGKGEINDGR